MIRKTRSDAGVPRPHRRHTNSFTVIRGVAVIDISTKTYPDTKALIDAKDLPRIIDGNGRWHPQNGKKGKPYATRWNNGVMEFMHHRICRIPKGKMCDHRDGDQLNNRRGNLRSATSVQNQGNRRPRADKTTSAFKGVRRQGQRKNKWTARIRFHGKEIHLGCFPRERLAAQAYDRAAQRYFGEFAKLNLAA